MTLLTNFKKLGVNTAVLATSISLVACGGGGSEGYYDKGSSGSSGNGNSGGNDSTTDTSQTAVSLNSKLQNLDGQNLQQASDNSKVRFAVQVLNADNGGISGKNVRLSIAGNALGVTSTNSLLLVRIMGILHKPQVTILMEMVVKFVVGTVNEQSILVNILFCIIYIFLLLMLIKLE